MGQIQSFGGSSPNLRRVINFQKDHFGTASFGGHVTHFRGEFLENATPLGVSTHFWESITHFRERLSPFGSSFGSEEHPSVLETHFGVRITHFGVVCNTLGGKITHFLRTQHILGCASLVWGVYHSLVGKIPLFEGEKFHFWWTISFGSINLMFPTSINYQFESLHSLWG